MALAIRACGIAAVALIVAAFGLACGGNDDGATIAPTGSGSLTLEVTSSIFDEGGDIPVAYTCDGENISPDLQWTGAPSGTKSFAVIVDDPDAGGFTHWLVFGIPANAAGLPPGVKNEPELANGSRQGTNSFGDIGYGPPCPPQGSAHTYTFQVYALDTEITLEPGAGAKDVLEEIEGHVLALGELSAKLSR